ncbi:MAG: CaiB/BaiF CoA-transferase family protein, partial [Bacilli bacterium]
QLIKLADVVIENFRPGTMEKLGLDYNAVKLLNPQIIYASVSGYVKQGPWKDKPGQDLLVQSMSGLAWLNGDADQPPVPFGLALADLFTGSHLVQGILACLLQRELTGDGGLVEVSLIESILDVQFEVLTTYLNDGGKLPVRSSVNSAHAYLGAPYGIYETEDGYIAIAMGSIIKLGQLLVCPQLAEYEDAVTWFTNRDEIKAILTSHLKTQTTRQWLDILEPADYWCAEVFTWHDLMDHEGFQSLNMIQEVVNTNGSSLQTLRCPIRLNGKMLTSNKGAPQVGEHNQAIEREFGISGRN